MNRNTLILLVSLAAFAIGFGWHSLMSRDPLPETSTDHRTIVRMQQQQRRQQIQYQKRLKPLRLRNDSLSRHFVQLRQARKSLRKRSADLRQLTPVNPQTSGDSINGQWASSCSYSDSLCDAAMETAAQLLNVKDSLLQLKDQRIDSLEIAVADATHTAVDLLQENKAAQKRLRRKRTASRFAAIGAVLAGGLTLYALIN